MNALKRTGNFLGVFLSSIISVVLVTLLLCAPLISAVCSFTQTQTIHKVIKDIDFVEIVAQHEELRTTLESYGIDGEFLDSVTETELVEQLVDCYVLSIFEGRPFNPQVVEDIIVSHKADTIALFRRLAEENGKNVSDLTDEEFFEQILLAVQTEWDTITGSLPSAEDMGITQENYDQWASAFANGEVLNAPKKLNQSQTPVVGAEGEVLSLGDLVMAVRAGTPMKAMTAIIIALSVLILLLRWPRLKGFLWLAVVYLLSAVLNLAMSIGLAALAASTAGITKEIAVPVSAVFTDEMTKCCIIFAVIGAVMMAVFILSRVLRKTSKKEECIPEGCDTPVSAELPACETQEQQTIQENADAEI